MSQSVLPHCTRSAQTVWQENPSWFRAMHLAGCSNTGEERACRRAGSTDRASCKAIARSPHNFPCAHPAQLRTSSGAPSRGSVESPFPERSPSTVYITAGVASSEQSRSLFGGWKSQGRQGNNDRSCWGGGKTRRISWHSIAQLGAAAAHKNGPLMASRVPAFPRVQQHRAGEKMILRYWLSFWDKGCVIPPPTAHSADEPLSTEADACRGQLSPPLVLGHLHKLIYLTTKFQPLDSD